MSHRPLLVASNRSLDGALRDGIDTARKFEKPIDVTWGVVTFVVKPTDTPPLAYQSYMGAARVVRAAMALESKKPANAV